MSNGSKSIAFDGNSFTIHEFLRCARTLKKMLAGSSPFPLSRAYPAPHLNQASPLVTNTAED